MKSRALIIAGCLLSLGIASCSDNKTEEPATNDTIQVTTPPVDSITPIDTATARDTALIDTKRTDTAIISTDTTVKAGKTVTTGTRDPKAGSKSTSSTKTTTPTPAAPETHGSTPRRDGGASEPQGTESRPRR